jgi:uncharacterized membrane protein YdbT with pleckstrin-like domain
MFRESTNSFDGQEKDEKVLMVVRKHPFIVIMRLLSVVLLCLIPLILGGFFTPYFIQSNLIGLFLFVSSLWYLAMWQLAFYMLTMFTLDIWIVTNKRIIDSTQQGFFNRTVSELYLSKVQDMSVHTDGLIETLLRFGNIEVQTAGTENKFKFSAIPHPEKVKDTIMEAMRVTHTV